MMIENQWFVSYCATICRADSVCESKFFVNTERMMRKSPESAESGNRRTIFTIGFHLGILRKCQQDHFHVLSNFQGSSASVFFHGDILRCSILKLYVGWLEIIVNRNECNEIHGNVFIKFIIELAVRIFLGNVIIATMLICMDNVGKFASSDASLKARFRTSHGCIFAWQIKEQSILCLHSTLLHHSDGSGFMVPFTRFVVVVVFLLTMLIVVQLFNNVLQESIILSFCIFSPHLLTCVHVISGCVGQSEKFIDFSASLQKLVSMLLNKKVQIATHLSFFSYFSSIRNGKVRDYKKVLFH
ncbi:hypothetical protein Tsp_11132 [Trichinella spiralis]|uniref:hypothetical protein n=1 Tax=Trichinella spiralis TaxID=6334 RepID=UPI0001EFEADB|nr:hypothetical protein Tsp_11132 [Trichinella spiralis]